jgi:hypothetical protein
MLNRKMHKRLPVDLQATLLVGDIEGFLRRRVRLPFQTFLDRRERGVPAA